MLPCLREARILRQWAGLCDMTPYYVPLLGEVEGMPGFILNCGWGTWGFRPPQLRARAWRGPHRIGVHSRPHQALRLGPFADGRLVNERAAAPAAAIQ